MIIQITGTNTKNKGAELMLASVANYFQQNHPSVTMAVTPHAGRFEQRCRYGLRQVNCIPATTRSGIGLRMLSESCRNAYGIVQPGEVNAVLDASGFAFGDSLGLERVSSFADETAAWKKSGCRILMLPQAVGPFEDEMIADAFCRAVYNVERVYLRDEKSYGFALEAGVDESRLYLAPDFTCSVPAGALPAPFTRGTYVAVVPNIRLVEQGVCSVDSWRKFARELCKFISLQGWHPVLLVHDDSGSDREMIGDLDETSEYEVFWHDDPRVLKAVIGNARLLVGSRYHALVSALSQGIPTIALGWSHKYEALLLEYGCPTCSASLDDWWDVLNEVLPRIKQDDSWRSWHYALLHEASLVKEKVAGLWTDVEQVLGLQREVS